MQKHILCVSYDELLLVTRRMLLEKHGYKVTTALTSQEATELCRARRNFDLFILGHSIPTADQQDMMKEFREHSVAPILSLRRRGVPIVPYVWKIFQGEPRKTSFAKRQVGQRGCACFPDPKLGTNLHLRKRLISWMSIHYYGRSKRRFVAKRLWRSKLHSRLKTDLWN